MNFKSKNLRTLESKFLEAKDESSNNHSPFASISEAIVQLFIPVGTFYLAVRRLFIANSFDTLNCGPCALEKKGKAHGINCES